MASNSKQVDFLICGTQKGGTTALRSYLRDHPDIEMPEEELHFFDNEVLFEGGSPDYSLYHSHFHNQSGNTLWGETTPIYMYWEPCPRRIYEYNPNMKLICLLRDPVERAYSHWNMEFNRGNEQLRFEDAVKQEQERLSNCKYTQHRVYSYLDRGFYSEQLKKLSEYFDRANFLLLKSSDLQNKWEETLRRVTTFLEISDFKVKNPQRLIHVSSYNSKLSMEDSNKLKKVFYEDMKILSQDFDVDVYKCEATE
ncbi:MAG: sulfotransferase domain-containing protein [Phycisphaerales bacterium]|nr:sulfotransferase domain-containing protein [Phycisphaerales bacterium]